MAGNFLQLPVSNIPGYPTFASFPLNGTDGYLAVALDTKAIYVFDILANAWLLVTSPTAILSIGLIDSQTKSSNGAVASVHALFMQTADATHPGLVSITTQTFAGDKTFTGTIAAANLANTNTGDVTLTNVGAVPNAQGASLMGQVLQLQPADATHPGVLTAADWNTFNNKLDASRFNFISNPDAELSTTGWTLYNDAGRTDAAYVVAQDITYTAVASGDAGNGINIDYIFHATQPSSTPLVTVVSSTHVTVAWYNGPTLANNPTATQLKAAWDAVPGAVALATATITGTASHRQYETGSNVTSNGGDTSPVDGTGGSVTGVTFTRNTTAPLAGTADFELSKDASSREGTGVSTEFSVNALDRGQQLQISFAYSGSTGMVLGSASDVQVFIYDIVNAALIPVTSRRTLAGPINTAKTFVGQFTASATGVNYRLILHIATANATAWNLFLDNVVVGDVLNPTAATQVPSVVLQAQPISGAVTDHMAVAWVDGAAQWVPATSAYNGDYWSMLGFATNILGATADIYVHGYMDGFSFGPFSGYNQYVDPAVPGGLTPLPSPFTDTYLIMGKAISSTAINIQVYKGIDLVTSKGGLLSNANANNGTGDEVLAVGSNGNVLVASSAAHLGLAWAPAVVAGTGLTYTTSTRSLTLSNLAGDITGAPQTNSISAATVTGKLLTGFVSGAGTVAATDTILQGIDKLDGNIVLKAPLASPTFTGNVNASTGNVLISTIGKGLQVKTGSNAKIGQAVLSGGTIVVSNTSVTANSRIFLTVAAAGGTQGFLRTTKSAGVSFTITSTSGTETSTVDWMIVESIP